MTLSQAAPAPLGRTTSLRSSGVLFAATLGNGLGVTTTVSIVFGVFLVPISREFHWARAEVSGAPALLSLVSAAAYPLAGWFGDRFGARRAALIGSFGLGALVLGLSLAPPQPAVFYAQFALIGAIGTLPTTMIYSKLLSEWFEARRGLWMGLTSGVGNGLGATLMPLLAAATVGPLGWRGSFIAIGLIILLIGFPLQVVLLKSPPKDTARGRGPATTGEDLEGVSTKAAAGSLSFWLILSSLPVGGGLLMAMAATMVPLLTDRGFSVGTASAAVAVLGLTCTVWEPSVGFFLDHTKRPRVLSLLYMMPPIGLLVMLQASSPIWLLTASVLVGLGMAAEFSALSFLLSRYFGRRSLGRISGIGFGAMVAIGSVAGVVLNTTFDLTQSYRLAVLGLIPFLIWNAAAPLLLGRYRFDGEGEARSARV